MVWRAEGDDVGEVKSKRARDYLTHTINFVIVCAREKALCIIFVSMREAISRSKPTVKWLKELEPGARSRPSW
jgi:hypothetical protein